MIITGIGIKGSFDCEKGRSHATFSGGSRSGCLFENVRSYGFFEIYDTFLSPEGFERKTVARSKKPGDPSEQFPSRSEAARLKKPIGFQSKNAIGFFSCHRSDDLRHMEVFPKPLRHISDEMRHSPACPSHSERFIRTSKMRRNLQISSNRERKPSQRNPSGFFSNLALHTVNGRFTPN